ASRSSRYACLREASPANPRPCRSCHRMLSTWALVWASIWLIPALTLAQRSAQTRAGQTNQTAEKGPNGQFTIRTSVTEVVLYATVIDEHQHLVTTLQKQNFNIFEDGARQTIS